MCKMSKAHRRTSSRRKPADAGGDSPALGCFDRRYHGDAAGEKHEGHDRPVYNTRELEGRGPIWARHPKIRVTDQHGAKGNRVGNNKEPHPSFLEGIAMAVPRPANPPVRSSALCQIRSLRLPHGLRLCYLFRRILHHVVAFRAFNSKLVRVVIHIGWRPPKLSNGGGDGIVHSSVVDSQGFSSAFSHGTCSRRG